MLASLGEAIRTYRLRQRQPHNGQPWTQEDLAVVIGTDKAHVNRIERNRQRPELKTLLAICEALRVSLYERCYLLGLAGYGLHLPRVGPDEERSVLAAAAPLIESCSYPLLIVDDCLRLLDMTELHARVFGPIYGGADRRSCLERMRGRPAIERMFTADGMAAVRALHENPERLLLRNVAQFRQAHQYRPDDPDLNAVLARLEHEDGFRRLWAQTVPPGGDLIFLEHDLMRVRCPELGAMLVFNVARTRLVWDERFWFSHHWPADATTAAALVELARRIARDQRRACLAG